MQPFTIQVGDVRYLPTFNLWGVLHHEVEKKEKLTNTSIL